MKTIRAIYEDGVFRPKERVDLPEHSEVQFSLAIVPNKPDQKRAMKEIRAILSESYVTNEPDLAARHNEHQS